MATVQSERERAYELALELTESKEYWRVSVVESEETGGVVAIYGKPNLWSRWETLVYNEENVQK